MIYVLEDDNSILELILYALKTQNITAKGFCHPHDLFESLKDELPEILILDIMLPQRNGFEILKNLKENARTKQISVIILSALNQEFDKVKGLELGADDYVAKPFGMMELIARINANLRRLGTKDKDEIRFNELILSFTKRQVSYKKNILNLTFKEFELLGFLLSNQERAFSRDELLEIIWGYSYDTQSRTIDIHIKTLRKKLGDLGKHIKTIRNIGYKFSKEL
ncbi:response regulator transcription factor [Helicobacter muridarum]|uniref:Phosphate regulon response regulator n=1 Tax=Helicobacter muridarum TaxID=216 RepID=A0A099TXH4_9HELI|nr:response regulator transcription factor [Helicobacter muridarum]TLE00010.1 response regulator transcription factor [Helicobacter muridarum]STQ87084.1 phosphate regulon response regulator [Helicobacter muridarum]